MAKKVSMQKIADEIGVSKVTVSKALNNKEGVSDELKEKIFKVADRYGYILPDYGQRKTIKIAVIINSRFVSTTDSGKFYMKMYEKIAAGLREYDTFCMMLTPTIETAISDLEMITDKEMIDGVILLGVMDEEVKTIVHRANLPKIYVDIYDDSYQSDSVVSENIYSTCELTEYLIRMGHTSIGFVGTIGSTTSISDRYLGYQRAMLEKRLPLNESWSIQDRNMNGEAITMELPSSLPSAFVCNCDETAYRLVRQLKDRGKRVPDDISVVSFDNDIYAELCEPQLTTVSVNFEQIGKVAAKRIMHKIRNVNKTEGKVYRVPGTIIYRNSVKNLNSDISEEKV